MDLVVLHVDLPDVIVLMRVSVEAIARVQFDDRAAGVCGNAREIAAVELLALSKVDDPLYRVERAEVVPELTVPTGVDFYDGVAPCERCARCDALVVRGWRTPVDSLPRMVPTRSTIPL